MPFFCFANFVNALLIANCYLFIVLLYSKSMGKSELVLYQPDSTVSVEVRLEDENVWLNRPQIAVLFDRDIKTIGKHINNALNEELAVFSTAADGKEYQVEHHNLDVILSVGYRISYKRRNNLLLVFAWG